MRGPEAFDLLQAMNTGHDGSMGTLHANSPREALSRVELMITMGGYSLPSRTIREMITGSIDVVVQAARLRDGSRRITHITEVMGMEGDVIITQDLFVYDMMGEDAQRQHRRKASLDRYWPAQILGPRALLRRGAAARRSAGRRRCRRAGADLTGSDRGHANTCPVLPGCCRDRWRRLGIRLSVLSGERQAERRKDTVVRTGSVPTRVSRARAENRDASRLKIRSKNSRGGRKNPCPPHMKISQAGLSWSKRQFIMISVGMGLSAFLVFVMIDAGPLAALGAGFAAGFGMPFWLLKFLKKRRETKFLEAFPDAVDTIVRGIKAGLPLLDSMRIITTEAAEPLRSEFRAIMETQAIGMPVGEACAKLYERMPLPEANFFGIVISIQQKAGGNLSEALGNLSRVLRDRKKMKAKIQAMSMEAKASASIIACLPIAVMVLVYITSPQYIELLWTHPTGRLMLACCARVDVDGRHGHAQDDQFRFLMAAPCSILIAQNLTDTRLLAMIFAAIAAAATVLTLAMPLLATDSLPSA